MVTLDRIAQCYQDVGEQEAADRYYRQAIRGYESYRKTREEAAASSTADPDAEMRIDSEITGVMHNYAQQLFHLRRWEDAQVVLQRALSLAKEQQSSEALDRLQSLQTQLRELSSATDSEKLP